MCFDAKTSLRTFSIAMISATYLFAYSYFTKSKKVMRIDIFSAIIIIFVGFIQLLEYFIWSDQSCGKQNRIASFLIPVTLYLQIIIFTFAAFYLFNITNKTAVYFTNILLSVFTLLFLISVKIIYDAPQSDLCSFPINSERLQWGPFTYLMDYKINGHYVGLLLILFNVSLYLFIPIFFSLFCIDYFLLFPVRYSMIALSLITSIMYSIFYCGFNLFDAFNSLWCFLANSFAIVSMFHI